MGPHGIVCEDVRFTLELNTGQGDLSIFASNALPRDTKLESVREVHILLRSNKADKCGTRTRTIIVLMDSERSRYFVEKLLIWCRLRGAREPHHLFFSQDKSVRFGQRDKNLTANMVNLFWDWLAEMRGLPSEHYSSKSAKIGSVSELLAGRGVNLARADPGKASFHASTRSQDHYRFQDVQQGGTCVLFNDASRGLATEHIQLHSRVYAKNIIGTRSKTKTTPENVVPEAILLLPDTKRRRLGVSARSLIQNIGVQPSEACQYKAVEFSNI